MTWSTRGGDPVPPEGDRLAFTLHQVGFTMTADVTAGPVRSYQHRFTLTRWARGREHAVSFLWHFP